eukprot:7391635-Prymnesium_polylepis.1
MSSSNAAGRDVLPCARHTFHRAKVSFASNLLHEIERTRVERGAVHVKASVGRLQRLGLVADDFIVDKR